MGFNGWKVRKKNVKVSGLLKVISENTELKSNIKKLKINLTINFIN